MKTSNRPNRIRTHRSADRRWAIHHGDVQDVLPTLPHVNYDAAFFDSPYGLKFMGHDWDGERDTPRRLLVPYSGSGSEMIASLSAGWDHVTGIEWHEPYVATARRRLSKPNDASERSA